MADQAGHSPGGRFAFAALLVANVFLSLGPWLVRLADVGPVAAGFWRVAIAAPLLLLLAAWSGGPRTGWNRALIAALVVAGLFFAADLASWHIGIMQTRLANATLFGNAASFLFAIYGFILLRRGPTGTQLLALLLALGGTLLLLGRSYELSATQLNGDLLTLLAGTCYTFYLIAIDRGRRSLGAVPVLAYATLASILPLLVFALLLGETIMPRNWTPVLLLAIGSQLIGQGLLVYAMGHVRPFVVGLTLLTQPAISGLVGWFFYTERLGVLDFAGALLVCVAIILIRLPSAEGRGSRIET